MPIRAKNVIAMVWCGGIGRKMENRKWKMETGKWKLDEFCCIALHKV
jgi:hypothetical protein